jgi:hypothetical protein
LRGKRHSEGLANAALESNLCCDLPVFEERHVLQQQPHQTLALAVRRLRILPEPWKVMRQGCDTRTLLFVDLSPIVFALVILLLGCMQRPQFVVPVGLEGIGYETVRWIYVKVASLSQVSLIPGSLNLLVAQTVHFIQSGLHLLLDGERDFQRQRSDRVDKKLTHSLVQVLTEDMLAYRDEVVGSIALAYILRHDLGLPRVVTDRHPAATDTADD